MIMNRIPVLIILFLLVSVSCEKEISERQADSFIKYFGEYLLDEGRDVEQLETGGYAICGTATLPDSGSRMVMIITDEYGNPMPGFPRYYTTEGKSAGGTTIVPKKGGLGGFLLCGFIEQPGPGGTGTQKDIFIVKTSSTGDVHWKRVYGSSEDDVILHATDGLSSGYMMAGYQEIGGEKDIMIMGLEEDGDSIPLGLNYNKPLNSEDAIASYILNTGESYLAVCTYDKIVGEGTDILVLNFDDELSPNDKVIRGNFDEYGKCIVRDTADRYIVLGNFIKEQTGKSEILLYFIETDGLLIKTPDLMTTISEIDSDLYAERLIKTGAGSFAIVGTRETDESSDIFLQFLYAYQAEPDRVIFGSSGDQSGFDIDRTVDGGLIITGSNRYGENSMITLIKTDGSGNL